MGDVGERAAAGAAPRPKACLTLDAHGHSAAAPPPDRLTGSRRHTVSLRCLRPVCTKMRSADSTLRTWIFQLRGRKQKNEGGRGGGGRAGDARAVSGGSSPVDRPTNRPTDQPTNRLQSSSRAERSRAEQPRKGGGARAPRHVLCPRHDPLIQVGHKVGVGLDAPKDVGRGALYYRGRRAAGEGQRSLRVTGSQRAARGLCRPRRLQPEAAHSRDAPSHKPPALPRLLVRQRLQRIHNHPAVRSALLVVLPLGCSEGKQSVQRGSEQWAGRQQGRRQARGCHHACAPARPPLTLLQAQRAVLQRLERVPILALGGLDAVG